MDDVKEPSAMFQAAQLAEVIYSEHLTPPPRPVMNVEYCGAYIADLHRKTAGPISAVGVYSFSDCFVGLGGLVLSKDKVIFDAPDLMSPYWRKLVMEKINSRNLKDPVYRFISGDDGVDVKEILDRDLVLLIKPGSSVYGHWLLDMLPMIWLYKRSRYFNPEAKFLVSAITPNWVFSVIDAIFGIKEDRFIRFSEANSVVYCRKIIVPSLMRASPYISSDYNFFTDDVVRICSRIVDLSVSEQKRIYISRGGIAPTASIKRYLVGEEQVEKCVKDRGFAIVRPELMSWPQQVCMFARAETVMGEFGSGLHNTVFSPRSTLNIVLSNSMMSWTQSAIAAMRGQPLQYIKPTSEIREGSRIDCTYDVTVIGRCLDELLGVR